MSVAKRFWFSPGGVSLCLAFMCEYLYPHPIMQRKGNASYIPSKNGVVGCRLSWRCVVNQITRNQDYKDAKQCVIRTSGVHVRALASAFHHVPFQRTVWCARKALSCSVSPRNYTISLPASFPAVKQCVVRTSYSYPIMHDTTFNMTPQYILLPTHLVLGNSNSCRLPRRCIVKQMTRKSRLQGENTESLAHLGRSCMTACIRIPS